MVAEHPSVALAQRAIDTFNRGDFDAYRDFFTEDVVWHVGGNHPLSGDYQGRDAIFAYFEKVRDLTHGTLRSEPEEGSSQAWPVETEPLFACMAQRRAVQAELDEIRRQEARLTRVLKEWKEAESATEET